MHMYCCKFLLNSLFLLDCFSLLNSHAGENLFSLKAFYFKYLYIYLPALGLSCSMWDLCCLVWDLSLGHMDSLAVVELVAPWHVGS